MYTPKQLDEITFGKALFGGYDVASVDQVLEPLTKDYAALYKENATLKSKMRLLLKKLETRPAVDESAGQKVLEDARRNADEIIRNANAQAASILAAAEAAAAAAKPAAPALPLDQICGIQYQMQQGKGRLNTTQFLGLSRDPDTKALVIIPEEAELV